MLTHIVNGAALHHVKILARELLISLSATIIIAPGMMMRQIINVKAFVTVYLLPAIQRHILILALLLAAVLGIANKSVITLAAILVVPVKMKINALVREIRL
jgi:hypothetical protein